MFNVSALLQDDALLKCVTVKICYRSRLVFSCCFESWNLYV